MRSSAEAQVRNPTSSSTPNTEISQSGILRRVCTIHALSPVMAANRMLMTMPVGRVGRSTSGSWIRSLEVESTMVLVPVRPKTTISRKPSTVKTPRMIGTFQLLMTVVAGPSSGSTGWVGWFTGAMMLISPPPPGSRSVPVCGAALRAPEA